MITDKAPEGTTIAEMTEAQERHQKVFDFFYYLGGYSPMRFLDIGCGNGTLTGSARAALGMECVDGVDILPAEKLDVPAWLRLSKADFNWDRLPYEDDSFGVILCGEVFEHLYNPDNLLKEIKRVLAPKGVCLITTPNLGSWFNRVFFLFGYQPCCMAASYYHEDAGKLKLVRVYGHRDHIRPMTLKALKELIELNGLKVKKTMGWNQGMLHNHLKSGMLSRSANLVDVVLSKIPSLSSRLAIVVTK